MPDRPAIIAGYRKRGTDKLTFGYPLLRLSVLVECGTRAILAATFGPEADGETSHARRLLHAIGDRMLVLADAGYDSWELLRDVAAKAHYLCRSGARRTPLILRELSDGSYLSVLGYGRLKVRIIEAWVTSRGLMAPSAASSGAWSPACSTTAVTPPAETDPQPAG